MRGSFTKLTISLVPSLLLITPLVLWHRYRSDGDTSRRDIARVTENYVKAIYSRDFASAYRWISARDHDAKSQRDYVKEQGAFTGVALQIAAKLAGSIEITAAEPAINGERAVVSATLKLPDVEKLAPLVLDWNEERLDALSRAEQNGLLAAIEERKRQSEIPFVKTQEKFQFVKENSQWKVFLDWRSGVRVEVKLKLPASAPLEVTPANSQIIFTPGEPFTIALKLRNNSSRELRARLVHNVEPKSMEKYLGVGDCGTFVPFRLAAGAEQANDSTFLVWTNLPAEIKRFSMIYDFEVDQQAP